MKKKIYFLFPGLLFCILIFAFSIISILKPDKDFSINENRKLTLMPSINKKDILNGTFEKQYESYVSDQFVFRDNWIRLKTELEILLGKKESEGVFFGKDQYLIEKYEDSDFNFKQVDKNVKRLRKMVNRYTKKLGKDHVKVLMVPTKSQILTDKLPKFSSYYKESQFIEQVKSHLPEGTFLDTTNLLLQHKEEAIYYRTDHHWTTKGAFYAYELWANSCGEKPFSMDDFTVKEVTDQFYGTTYSKVNKKVKPDTIEIYYPKFKTDYRLTYNLGEKKTDTLYDFEQLKGKDKYAVFLGGNQPLVEIQSNQKNNKTLLVIKDSFSHCFLPFAVNHFSFTVIADLRHFNASVNDLVKMYQPTDILVLYNTVKFMQDTNTLKMIK